MKKESRGITLIALIITIIVMLILVGVTINVISNIGIIDKAQEAASKTNKAQDEEKEFLATWEIQGSREELLKKYPVGNVEFTVRTDPFLVLENLNIIDLYEYILEEYYDSSYETLTLEKAIKAVNKLVQIYGPEVEDVVYKYPQMEDTTTYWEKLTDTVYLKQEDGTLIEVSEEDNMKLAVIGTSYFYSEDYNSKREERQYIMTINNGRYILYAAKADKETIGSSQVGGMDLLEEKDMFDMIYPGGSLPFDKISNNTTFSNFKPLLSSKERKIVKLNENNLNDFYWLDEENPIENYIGAYVFVSETLTVDDGRPLALLCHNDVVIDTKMGYVYYIDDNGKSDVEIPE